MFCPECGTESKPGQKFCRKCGSPLPQQSSAERSQSSAQPSQNMRPSHSAQPKPALKVSKAPRSKIVVPLAILCGALVVALIVVLVRTFAGGGGIGASKSEEPSGTHDAAATHGTIPTVEDPETGEQVVALQHASLVAPIASAPEPDVQAQADTYTVESNLSNVINADRVKAQPEVADMLQKQGFAVFQNKWGGEEFFSVYETNRYNLDPNFVTVDSLMHTYHLYYQYLQKNTERSRLAACVQDMSKQLLATSAEQLKELEGTEWEEAAKRNTAFFAVGASLQDPNTEVPTAVANVVSTELKSIRAHDGIAMSPLLGDEVDYSQYIVRGYYEGDDTLEAYFRTMMWYGQLNFTQKDEDLDRSALLMTMALKDDALKNWEAVYAVTSFFAGASDDSGYYEYKPILDVAYGTDVTTKDLVGNDKAWQHFHNLTKAMPAPQINSVPRTQEEQADEDATKGFRLMGQRFTFDEMIFTRLTTPNVGKNSSGKTRTLPMALDVPASLGSDEALDITKAEGAADFEGYEQNVRDLREQLANESDPRWSSSLYGQWLYTLNPLLGNKREGYPAFMQSTQWARKDLLSYLGSYTELKHDTVLYSKQMMAEMGGDIPKDKDDRGYVEPEPVVFKRLANLTASTRDGLANYKLLADEDAQNLDKLEQLASQLATIASKELAGELPSDDEFELIRSYGGQLEHFWQEAYRDEAKSKRLTVQEYPAAIVTDVATDASNGAVLELGTGRTMTIYAVVPVDGKLRIATGTVYSYYEFEQPLSNRLTDSSWRQMLGMELNGNGKYNQDNAPSLPTWTDGFVVQPN